MLKSKSLFEHAFFPRLQFWVNPNWENSFSFDVSLIAAVITKAAL